MLIRKRIVFLVFSILCLFGIPFATAKDAVAPSDSPEAEVKKEEKPKNVGYDKGFFIKSSDGKFKLVINGYGQFQLDYDRENGENKVGFKVRRARLSLSGNLAGEKLTYKLQVDFTKFKDNLLLDYYMDYKIHAEDFRVRFGQQTIPWIRQHIISSSQQEFIDRSIASLEFINVQDVDSDKDGVPDKQTRDGRDIGVVLHGKPFNKKLEYNAGFFNGSGPNSANFNNHFLYSGRAVYNVLGDYGYEEGDYEYSKSPSFFIGAAGNYNVRDLTNRKITQFGGETGLKFRGFAATGEFFFRNSTQGDTTLGNTNDFGYYAQLGYFAIPKKLEFVTRASQIFLEGIQNDKAEFAAGINGYLLGQHLKLQTGYSVLPNNTKEGVETSQKFQLRLQTKF